MCLYNPQFAPLTICLCFLYLYVGMHYLLGSTVTFALLQGNHQIPRGERGNSKQSLHTSMKLYSYLLMCPPPWTGSFNRKQSRVLPILASSVTLSHDLERVTVKEEDLASPWGRGLWGEQRAQASCHCRNKDGTRNKGQEVWQSG